MKITIVSPLYPPDIAESASHIKELAERLKKKMSVTLITYGKIPEKIEGVKIITIQKSYPTFIKITLLLFTLIREFSKTDFVYAENGPSIELPVYLALFFIKPTIIFHLGDNISLKRSEKKFALNVIYTLLTKKANYIIKEVPLPRPEIHPLKDYPKEEFVAYEKSWEEYLQKLKKILKYE